MNALTLMQRALALWEQVHPGESLDQMCQRFSGYYVQWAYQGNEAGITVYGSAKAAALASKIESGGINSAPVGSFIYWQVGTYWHVGNVVGYDGKRALVCYATTKGDTVKALSHGVKISHADTYPATFYGWSWTNGKNPRMTGITPWPEHVAPNQRQVLASASVNRRTDPTSLAEKIGSAAAGSIVTMTGCRAGEVINGIGDWFTDGHGWMWAGGFTDRGTHDLADLTPAPPVEPEPTPEPSPPVEVPPVPEPEPLPDPETPAEPGTVPPLETPPEKTEKPTDTWPVWQAIAAVIGTAILGVISWVAGWWT